MRRPHGVLIVTDPEGATFEADTARCGHCQQVVATKPGSGATVYLVPAGHGWREEPGAFCRVCMAPVCLACHAVGRCVPWERQLEQVERRARG